VGIQSLSGLVCPRCRHRAAEQETPVVRCPRDGFGLVAASVLAEADGDPLLGMTVVDRYVVLGKIGRGATGTVYRSFDTRAERFVALKILRADWAHGTRARARFECEARVLSMLSSPNTVKLLDVGEFELTIGDDLYVPGPSRFLAMEMLEGEPLSKRLERAVRLPVADAIRWATDTLGSLAEAHERGIVHRDITPNNLFIARMRDGEELGKVVDIGLAVFAREVFPDGDEFAAIGTPRYMSPEQARGEVLDGRSDLYSVGLLLYQMLTGKPPFTDCDAARVMARHMNEVPLPITIAEPEVGVPQWLSDVVARALAKRPDDRMQTAHDFTEAMRAGGPG
jgi:eukaryotic-like serine/threonine-protein kinase